jgi:uncharacterized membrane protein YdjX (TVP38/TMEM64 family)
LHAFLHHERIPKRIQKLILWCFAALVIASPLPDELGVALVSGVTKIEQRSFAILCLAMNTLGILIILLLARAAHIA